MGTEGLRSYAGTDGPGWSPLCTVTPCHLPTVQPAKKGPCGQQSQSPSCPTEAGGTTAAGQAHVTAPESPEGQAASPHGPAWAPEGKGPLAKATASPHVTEEAAKAPG